MESQDFPEDVLESFKGELGSAIFLPWSIYLSHNIDNEMDVESLTALLQTSAGPHC